MYNLRVEVAEIKGFCDLPMVPGDYFEVKGGKIIIPPGKHMCLWALQSLMPFLPLKQRQIQEENDWVPYTKHVCCPDPNGMVIYKIEVIGDNVSEKEIVRERMLVDESKCTGCRKCESVCEVQGIRIEQNKGNIKFSPKVCRQCGNAACISICPTGALSKDPVTKAIKIDSESCIGCMLCSKECPFDSISFDDNGMVKICDLCSGDPKCVQECSVGAITFGRKGEIY